MCAKHRSVWPGLRAPWSRNRACALFDDDDDDKLLMAVDPQMAARQRFRITAEIIGASGHACYELALQLICSVVYPI